MKVYDASKLGDEWMESVDESACPNCHGMKHIREDVPVGHPDFGKLKPCPNPIHVEEQLGQRLANSGLKYHERYVLDDIVPLDQYTSDMVDAVRQFITDGKGWLYLWGNVGTAKSLALMAAVNEVASSGRKAYYTTFADLLDVLKDAFTEPRKRRGEDTDGWNKHDTFLSRFRRMQNVYLLAIDEFDSERVSETPWVHQLRGQLLDWRYRDAVGASTITMLAGNQPPNHLPVWMYDRINDGRFGVFHHKGESARDQMQWNQFNGEN